MKTNPLLTLEHQSADHSMQRGKTESQSQLL